MGKWEMVRLGDVCQFINGDRGLNYPSKKDFVEVGVPFINAGHLSEKSVNFSEMNYISFEKFMQLGSGKVQNGDILYCLRGSLGKQAIVEDINIGAIASSLVILRPLSELAVKYLSYCLQSDGISKQQLHANTGSSQPNLSATNVKNYFIPLPPLDEQKRIAKNLDLASEIIKGYKEQLAELDKLVQSVFYEMFGDPVTNEKGWEVKLLSNICDGIGDGLHGTPTYDENGKYPFINGNNLVDGHIIITGATKYIGENEYQRLYVNIAENAILISINGTLGKLALYNGEKISLSKSACYCNLKPEINRLFVYWLMKSREFTNFLENSSTKSTIKNVGLKAMREFKTILPPRLLQTHFAAIVTEIEAQKAQVQQALTEAENLFNSLMQEYFE